MKICTIEGCEEERVKRTDGTYVNGFCPDHNRERALAQAKWTNAVARESYALAGGFAAYNRMDHADRMAIRSWVKRKLKNGGLLMLRECSTCKVLKEPHEFNKSTNWVDDQGIGRHNYCKTCHRGQASSTQTVPRSIVCRDEPMTQKEWNVVGEKRRAELKEKHADAIQEALGTLTNATSLNYDRDNTDYLYPGLKDRRVERVKRYAPVDREDQEKAKDGLIYVITNPAWPDHCKIGETTDLKERLRQYQTASPHRDYEVAFYLYVEDRKAMERAVFNALVERGLNEKGEWFFINQWHAENLIYKVKRDSQKENDNAHTNSRHRGQRVPPCSGHDLAG